MNTAELADKVAAEHNLGKAEAKRMVETVLSTIPKGLETRSRVYADTDNDTLMAKKDTPDGTTPSITKVEWKAPAKTVSLLRADDSWEGKVPMHQECVQMFIRSLL